MPLFWRLTAVAGIALAAAGMAVASGGPAMAERPARNCTPRQRR
jgi:hypothetical protein